MSAFLILWDLTFVSASNPFRLMRFQFSEMSTRPPTVVRLPVEVVREAHTWNNTEKRSSIEHKLTHPALAFMLLIPIW